MSNEAKRITIFREREDPASGKKTTERVVISVRSTDTAEDTNFGVEPNSTGAFRRVRPARSTRTN